MQQTIEGFTDLFKPFLNTFRKMFLKPFCPSEMGQEPSSAQDPPDTKHPPQIPKHTTACGDLVDESDVNMRLYYLVLLL